MNKFTKKLLSITVTLILLITSVLPMSATATTYPSGVTASQAENAIDNTDKLISGLLSQLGNTSLKEMLMPEICSGTTLSMLLIEVYKALEENSDSISALGIDVSVSNVAYYLSNYPEVSKKLYTFSSWSQVNLDGVNWGVKDKQGFAVAASAMFGPLNSLLYTLLCGGTYPIMGALVSIKGEKGYENSILPIYESLGCTTYTSPASFYALATANKYSIVAAIALDLMGYIEKILDAPAEMLTENLPSIAYFINSGELNNVLTKLLEPLKISVMGVPILSIDSVVDLGTVEGGMNINMDLGNISLSDFRTAPLDLDTFASCGTLSGNRVIPRKGDVYIELLRWFIETLKLNQSFIIGLLSSDMIDMGEHDIDMNSLITNLLSKPTDEIISILVNLLAGEKASVNNYQWSFRPKRDAAAVYTANLTKEDFARALSETDTLVDQIVAEGGEYTTLRQMLEPMLYSNSLLTQVVSELYMMLQGEDMQKFIGLLGIDLAPDAVAKSLTEEKYSTVASQLSNLSSWEYINKDTINWGFTDGDKEGFIDAVSAVLRPADSLFRMLLAGGKITLLDSVDFYGSDGYNTAVIPLLEALGVYREDILSYNEYLAAINGKDAIKPIVTSLFSLIERVMDKPVYTVTEILPNLMYFLNNGGLSICTQNLIYPVMNILNQLGLSGLIDFSALTDIDVNALISSLTNTFEIDFAFPTLNLSQFEGMGELVTVDSKRTQNGSAIRIYAIKADQPAVLVTLLRFVVETIKQPGNDSFIVDLISSSEDLSANSMITSFAKGIADNIGKMTVDETVEWIFGIFFSKRVTVDNLTTDEYTPEISYEGKNNYPSGVATTVILIALMLAAIVTLSNRDKIKFFLQDLKANKGKKN